MLLLDPVSASVGRLGQSCPLVGSAPGRLLSLHVEVVLSLSPSLWLALALSLSSFLPRLCASLLLPASMSSPTAGTAGA